MDMEKLQAFMGKMLGDVGAAMNASLMLVGDKLGLYKAMAVDPREGRFGGAAR